MASEETKADILTQYLKDNPAVRELLEQYSQAKEVMAQADAVESAAGLLYPFYSYSANS